MKVCPGSKYLIAVDKGPAAGIFTSVTNTVTMCLCVTPSLSRYIVNNVEL